MEDFKNPDFMPLLNEIKQLKCDQCGYTFDDIVNTGKLGCGNCYSVFEERLDPIIKRIQGSNKHVGRIGKVIDNKIENNASGNGKEEQKSNNEKAEQNQKSNNKENENKLEKLQNELKQAIKEERYEDAAKIRDEIKKVEG